jgi:hypothetical protein
VPYCCEGLGKDSVASIVCRAWAISPDLVDSGLGLLVAVVLFVTHDPWDILRMLGTWGGPTDRVRRGSLAGVMVTKRYG